MFPLREVCRYDPQDCGVDVWALAASNADCESIKSEAALLHGPCDDDAQTVSQVVAVGPHTHAPLTRVQLMHANVTNCATCIFRQRGPCKEKCHRAAGVSKILKGDI